MLLILYTVLFWILDLFLYTSSRYKVPSNQLIYFLFADNKKRLSNFVQYNDMYSSFNLKVYQCEGRGLMNYDVIKVKSKQPIYYNVKKSIQEEETKRVKICITNLLIYV